jgi:hypothetical protein
MGNIAVFCDAKHQMRNHLEKIVKFGKNHHIAMPHKNCFFCSLSFSLKNCATVEKIACVDFDPLEVLEKIVPQWEKPTYANFDPLKLTLFSWTLEDYIRCVAIHNALS